MSHSANTQPDNEANAQPGLDYRKPAQEQELRADLEEVWQDESQSTARRTDVADQVDGRRHTRHRPNDD